MTAVTPALPRVEIRGIKRFGVWTPDTTFTIIHTMLLREDSPSSIAIDAFLSHAPLALMHTFNRHPRMRARLVAEEFAVAEIHPNITLDDVHTLGLFQIQHVGNMEDDQGSTTWQAFIQQQVAKPFDRVRQFGFRLHLWVDRTAGHVRLLLFSDHYVSDGHSGNTILNDVLSIASALARGDDVAVTKLSQPLPLRGSVYEQTFNSRPWLHAMFRSAIGFTGKTLMKMFPPLEPLIKPRAGHKAFSVPPPINASTLLFATGSQANLDKLLTRCREENTSFFGALTAAIVVAFAAVSEASDQLSMKLSLMYNMRSRMPTPVYPETVGFYAISGSLEKLMPNGGIRLATARFWDVARAAKREADDEQHSFALTYLIPMFLDLFDHSETPTSFFDGLPPDEYASVGDVSISSLGRYAHATTHAFTCSSSGLEGAALRVEALHFNCCTPSRAPLTQFYVTSVPHGIGYGINSNLDDAMTKRILDAVVRVMETAWGLKTDATLSQARNELHH